MTFDFRDYGEPVLQKRDSAERERLPLSPNLRDQHASVPSGCGDEHRKTSTCIQTEEEETEEDNEKRLNEFRRGGLKEGEGMDRLGSESER